MSLAYRGVTGADEQRDEQRGRLMAGTPDPRVVWLRNFTEMRLPPFRGGWGVVRQELARFCVPAKHPGGRGVVVGRALTKAPAPEAEIRALQEDVRRLVAEFGEPSAVPTSALPRATVHLITSPSVAPEARSILLVTAPTWRATALGVAIVLVSREPVPPLVLCPNPDCHEGPNRKRRFFVRMGKQKFCSPRCATRIYMRRRRNKVAAERRRGRRVLSEQRS
jgi:hypothetical protein